MLTGTGESLNKVSIVIVPDPFFPTPFLSGRIVKHKTLVCTALPFYFTLKPLPFVSIVMHAILLIVGFAFYGSLVNQWLDHYIIAKRKIEGPRVINFKIHCIA